MKTMPLLLTIVFTMTPSVSLHAANGGDGGNGTELGDGGSGLPAGADGTPGMPGCDGGTDPAPDGTFYQASSGKECNPSDSDRRKSTKP